MRATKWMWVLVALLTSAGCTLLLAGDSALCDAVVDCVEGQTCTGGFCVGAVGEGEGEVGEGQGEVGEGEGEVGEGEGEEGEGEGEVGEGEGEPGEGEGEGEPLPPAHTCLELFQRGVRVSGTYGIDLSGDGTLNGLERTIQGITFLLNETAVFCDMTRNGGGWTRVGFFAPLEGVDFTGDSASPCLAGFDAVDFGGGNVGCARATGGASQPGLLFPTLHPYTEVMGKVVGVVFGDADGFAGLRNLVIDDVYVDGVSITTTAAGIDEHVFTLVGAHPLVGGEQCPCEAPTVAPPAFVGDAFVCDRPTVAARPGAANEGRAYDVANPVWDNNICPGCADGVWARTTTTAHGVNDDLVLRLMHDQETADENIALTRIELFIR